MRFLFDQIFFLPLYNGLVWLAAVIPGQNLAVAVIILTLAVKFILFPLQHRLTRTQKRLRQLEPKLREIKAAHTKDSVEQARQTMALYREHGINPLSGFWLLLIQIPILLALFLVFRSGFDFKPEWLYSFVSAPAHLNLHLGPFLDLTGRNYGLAVATGLSQFVQARLMVPASPNLKPAGASWRDDLSRSLQLQMRYFFPILVVFFTLSLPAAVGLYWLTSNLFAIAHEGWVRRQIKNPQTDSAPTDENRSY